MVQAPDQEASWMSPCEGVLGNFNKTETKSQHTRCRRECTSHSACGVPQEELQSVAEDMDICNCNLGSVQQ